MALQLHVGTTTVILARSHRSHKTTADKQSQHELYEDLANRMALALEDFYAGTHDAWEENKHPRADNGQFGSGGGSAQAESITPVKPTTTMAKAAKAALHELFSSGHAFSKQELMDITGIKSEKLFSDYIAMLKNPKYAGKAGALEIKRLSDGSFQVVAATGTAPETPKPEAPKPTIVKPVIPAVGPTPTAKPVASAQRTTKEIEAQFARHSVEQIHQHFKSNYGLGFINGNGVKTKIKALEKEYAEHRAILNSPTSTLEQRVASREWQNSYYQKRNAILSSERHPADYLRGHTHIDVNEKSAKAVAMRKAIGHVDAALADLQARGFDIKKALENANVHFVAGSTGSAGGHAWQHSRTGHGHFSIHPDKILNEKKQARNLAIQADRTAAGKPLWSTGNAPGTSREEAAKQLIIHELTHALGMQAHIGSPSKLAKLLPSIVRAGHGGSVPSSPLQEAIATYSGPSSVSEWVKRNISEYAAKNIKETDAELGALVTSAGYKRGTLPKELEDHIDSLFHRSK